MARSDASPVVRKYLAATLQRLAHAKRWSIIDALVQHEEDATDHNIPMLLWLGIEPLVAEEPERALEVARVSRIPKITEYVGRRLVDAGQMAPLLVALRTHRNADLLRGMLSGLEGMNDLQTPEGWARVYRRLRRSKETRSLATAVAQRFGDADAMRELADVVLDTAHTAAARREALRSLAARQSDALRHALPGLVDEHIMRREAIRAVGGYDDVGLGEMLLASYQDADAATRQEIIQTMASRPAYGWMLVEALRDSTLTRSDIPVWIARQMRRVVGSGFVELWGPIDELPGNKAAQYARYSELVQSGRVADPQAGAEVFTRTCGVCHQMYGQGGLLGPDLTGANRTSVDYLLSNLIYPEEFIQDGYRMVIVTMRDGRTWLGSIVAENDRQVTLRPVGQADIVLSRAEVQSMEVSEASLMPGGLLESLSEREVLDLFAFLRTTEASAL